MDSALPANGIKSDERKAMEHEQDSRLIRLIEQAGTTTSDLEGYSNIARQNYSDR